MARSKRIARAVTRATIRGTSAKQFYQTGLELGQKPRYMKKRAIRKKATKRLAKRSLRVAIDLTQTGGQLRKAADKVDVRKVQVQRNVARFRKKLFERLPALKQQIVGGKRRREQVLNDVEQRVVKRQKTQTLDLRTKETQLTLANGMDAVTKEKKAQNALDRLRKNFDERNASLHNKHTKEKLRNEQAVRDATKKAQNNEVRRQIEKQQLEETKRKAMLELEQKIKELMLANRANSMKLNASINKAKVNLQKQHAVQDAQLHTMQKQSQQNVQRAVNRYGQLYNAAGTREAAVKRQANQNIGRLNAESKKLRTNAYRLTGQPMFTPTQQQVARVTPAVTNQSRVELLKNGANPNTITPTTPRMSNAR